jgi:hypothetical protein
MSKLIPDNIDILQLSDDFQGTRITFFKPEFRRFENFSVPTPREPYFRATPVGDFHQNIPGLSPTVILIKLPYTVLANNEHHTRLVPIPTSEYESEVISDKVDKFIIANYDRTFERVSELCPNTFPGVISANVISTAVSHTQHAFVLEIAVRLASNVHEIPEGLNAKWIKEIFADAHEMPLDTAETHWIIFHKKYHARTR